MSEHENNILARENEMLKAENDRLHVRCTVLDECWNNTIEDLRLADRTTETLNDILATKDRYIAHLADGNRKMDTALNALEQGYDHYHVEAQLQKARADRLERVIIGMNNNLTELINLNESELMNK